MDTSDLTENRQSKCDESVISFIIDTNSTIDYYLKLNREFLSKLESLRRNSELIVKDLVNDPKRPNLSRFLKDIINSIPENGHILNSTEFKDEPIDQEIDPNPSDLGNDLSTNRNTRNETDDEVSPRNKNKFERPANDSIISLNGQLNEKTPDENLIEKKKLVNGLKKGVYRKKGTYGPKSRQIKIINNVEHVNPKTTDTFKSNKKKSKRYLSTDSADNSDETKRLVSGLKKGSYRKKIKSKKFILTDSDNSHDEKESTLSSKQATDPVTPRFKTKSSNKYEPEAKVRLLFDLFHACTSYISEVHTKFFTSFT